MNTIVVPFEPKGIVCEVPQQTQILSMKGYSALPSCQDYILQALQNPIGAPSLNTIIRKKLIQKENPQAVIVVFDNTRPVPYTGDQGILWPIITIILEEGIPAEQITILVATGNNRALSEQDIVQMLDQRVLSLPIYNYSHQFRKEHYELVLGIDDSQFIEKSETVEKTLPSYITRTLSDIATRLNKKIEALEICYVSDRSYGIPYTTTLEKNK